MKRLLSLLIVLALVAAFMVMSTGVASADAPEKTDKMLRVVPPGWDIITLGIPITLPLTAQDGAETAGEYSPALQYTPPS